MRNTHLVIIRNTKINLGVFIKSMTRINHLRERKMVVLKRLRRYIKRKNLTRRKLTRRKLTRRKV